MKLTAQDLAREVSATGFSGESLETVFRLMGLLDALNSHPFLKTRIVLKGGTLYSMVPPEWHRDPSASQHEHRAAR